MAPSEDRAGRGVRGLSFRQPSDPAGGRASGNPELGVAASPLEVTFEQWLGTAFLSSPRDAS